MTQAIEQKSDLQLEAEFRIKRLVGVFGVLGLFAYLIGAFAEDTLNPIRVAAYMYTKTLSTISYQMHQFDLAFDSFGVTGFNTLAGVINIVTGVMLALLLELGIYSYQNKSLRAGYMQSSLGRILRGNDPSIRSDTYLIFYYLFALDRIVIGLLGLLGPFYIYAMLLSNFRPFSLPIMAELPGAAVFFIYVLIGDFTGYWYHRLAHNVTSFWELHKYHHSATTMNMITAQRNHPFEVAIQLPLKAIAIIIVGPSLHGYLAYSGIIVFLIMLHHSNFAWKWGFLDKIFVTPQFHRLHHSSLPEHHDMNYGVLFSFWDTLFGTRYRGTNQIVEFGVTDNYFNQKGFWHDMYMPMVKFCKGIYARQRII